MKTWLLLLLPVAAFAQRPKPVLVHGELRLAQPVAQVFISYRTPDGTVLDSVQPKKGVFTYKTNVAEPTLATLSVSYNDSTGIRKSEPVPLFLQTGKIIFTAKDSLKNYTVRGSAAHTGYLHLTAQEKPYADSMDVLYDAWSRYHKEGNAAAQEATEQQIDSIDKAMREAVYKTFVQAHPRSPVALYAVKQYAGYDINPAEVGPLFGQLPEQTRQWPSALSFQEAISIARKTGIGRQAMNFTQTDTANNPVSLFQFRGRYVLVDFWASWCGPCRAENPNVVRAFNQYKDKGFTILSVSLDRPNGRERWLKAIHDDGLTWTHVSDLKFWDNAVARQYGIRMIPQNVLIDPQGKIVARNLRGVALSQKLAALLGPSATF